MTETQAPGPASIPVAPVAKTVPHRMEAHGHERVDDYYWLRDRDDPEVLAYLAAENAYAEAVMAPTKAFEDQLYDEIVGRIKQTDLSVPYLRDGYYYYVRFEEGKEYPIYCRRRGSLDADEELILDVNGVAEGHDFCMVGPTEVSAEGNILAYPVDFVGRRIFTVRFRDLGTGRDLPDELLEVTWNLAWANDNRTLFYVHQDPETLRPNRVFRHVLGTPPTDDVLVYEEADEEFECMVWRTKSKRFMVIESSQTVSTEVRLLDADHPDGALRVLLPRERDHEYHVDHYGEHLYIRTNLAAPNFRLVRCPIDDPAPARWEEVLSHRDDAFLEGIEMFRDFLVAEERRDGLLQFRVMPWSGDGEHYVDFGEPAYLAFPMQNYDLASGTLRYLYTSLTTPHSTYDYDMRTRERTLLKREEVVGTFDPADYRTERVHAVASDGERIPISLVYRRDQRQDGQNALLLYGYGSYGMSMDATFSSPRLSLLDRGFVFAIAHIRGGQELGRRWYDGGRLLNKMNSFTDFIACAEHLVRAGYAEPNKVFALGGSAGGLLMGAVVNLRPELWRGVVAAVPFVDVVSTMLDDAIPLTTGEYDEWGNPHDKAFHDYMLSYSPYDNVTAKDYPAMMVTTGLHDSQVQFWEPAKWVARLRAVKTDDRRLILRTKMDAGHGGRSGRFRMHRETAQVYSFMLSLLGIQG